jgi:hypothetical protein
MHEHVVRRPSLPLTARDEHELDRLRQSPVYRDALERVAGQALNEAVSEAVLLHAIFAVGLDCVRRAAEESGYAALAADQVAEDEDHRSTARRRRPSWADE